MSYTSTNKTNEVRVTSVRGWPNPNPNPNRYTARLSRVSTSIRSTSGVRGGRSRHLVTNFAEAFLTVRNTKLLQSHHQFLVQRDMFHVFRQSHLTSRGTKLAFALSVMPLSSCTHFTYSNFMFRALSFRFTCVRSRSTFPLCA